MNLTQRLANAYGSQHPEAVSRLVETRDPRTVADFLGELTPRVAASVATRSAPLAIAAAIEVMAPDKAVGVLTLLNPWSAAALLGRLDPASKARLLQAMPRAAATPVRRLLDYSPDQAGSRMDPRAPSVLGSRSTQEAIAAIQNTPGGALYYVYVIDEAQKLQGVVNMRELLSADSATPVFEVMVKHPERVLASDPVAKIVLHPAWQKVHALPVVDAAGHFLGAIRYSAFRRLEAETGRAAAGPDPSRTAGALAELFWLGASAVTRTAESALVGSTQRPTRSTP